VCLPRSAHAESEGGLGTWEGSGVMTEAGNKVIGSFDVTVTRTSLGGGKVRSDGKVRTGDGKEITFWQEKTDRGGGAFQLVSNNGSGGGCCFVNGMCQSLESNGTGQAFASTIVMDAPAKIRVLITELKDGHAVRFYAQSLTKKP